MSVQAIDKRTSVDTSTYSSAQGQGNSTAATEDAFIALVQQASRRFAHQATVQSQTSSVLSTHLSQARQADDNAKAATTRDSAGTDRSDKTQDRRSDKTAQRADTARDTTKDDTATASGDPAPADDSRATRADESRPRDDQGNGRNDDQAQTDAQAADQTQGQTQAADAAQMRQAMTAQTAPLAPPPEAPETQASLAQGGPALPAQAADAQAGQSAGAQTAQTAPSGSAQAEQTTPAFDEAVQQAAQTPNQTGTANAAHGASTHAARHDAAMVEGAEAQADDLAQRLADTGAQIQVKVEATQARAAQADQAAITDAQTPVAAQAGTAGASVLAPQTGSNTPSGGEDTGGRLTAATPTQTSAAPQAQGQEEPTAAFSTVLAAQIEANGAAADATPDVKPLGGPIGVSGPQAADRTSTAQAAQTPRTARVPLQQQVMDQVSVQIDKAVKDGADSVNIQLKPRELGKIEIKLDVAADGSVSATVTADKPETLALLQKDSRGLEKALQDAGLKPDSSATTFNLRSDQQQQQQGTDRGQNQTARGGQGGSGGQGGNGSNGGTDGQGSQAAAQAAFARAAAARSGVDISV